MRSLIVVLALTVSTATAPRPHPGGPGAQETPARDGTPRTGTGTIRGRVTAMGDGAPLPRATVTVGGPGERMTVAETDDRGGYEFTGLAKGHYLLSVRRRGYVQPAGGRSITLGDGEAARVDVALERGGTISGRVFDEFGEPMTDVGVEALQVIDGHPTQGGGRTRETDDEGRFRLFELQSGKYVLRAEPMVSTPPPTGSRPLLYTPAFAPGVPDPAAAQVVVIGTTRDVTGIDVRLTKQRIYRVAGTVLDSRGQPLRRGFIYLSRDTGGGSRSGDVVPTAADGGFLLEGLTPGEYWVQVGTEAPGSDAEPEGDGEYASQTLDVQDDIDDLGIVTKSTATVLGEVIFEGAPAGFALPRDVQIGAMPANNGPPGTSPPSMASVGEDRRFTLRRLAGPSLVRKTSRAPEGWWLQRVTYRADDVTDVPTEFRTSAPGEVDLQVLFTNRVARVSGTVTDANGAKLGGAWVLAFAHDRPNDIEHHSADRMAMTDDRGAFTLAGLVGDKYSIVAFDPREQNPSSGLFKRMMPLATAISVTPGDSRVMDLRVTAVPAQ